MQADIEKARLQALQAYRVLDTPPEAAFDRLTALAADFLDAPIAVVSLVDSERQWFKSIQGLDACETPRDVAFCSRAIDLEQNGVLVVPDALLDPRFADNPLVLGEPHVRFYAGAVLTSPSGYNLGTLCVIDTKPRPRPSERDLDRLRALARIAVDELELTRASRLAEERNRLLDLAETMSGVGHWRHMIKTGEVFWSDELYRIHGVTRETFDLAFDNAVDFYLPEDRAVLLRLIEEAIETRGGYDFELRLRRADGETRIVSCRGACELDKNGEAESMFGVFQDVTEQVRALEQARAAMVAKSEFLANMSHELRTPLTSVIGFSGLLQQSARLPADERRYADRINTGSQALLTVINDILDFSKLEAGGVELDPHPFDVMGLARETLDMIEAEAVKKGLELSVTGGVGLDGQLIGDSQRLRQVMLNFLSNAAKFTAKGAITLDARGEVDGQGGVRLKVSVIDTGIGFQPEQAARLFERFVQADGSTTRNYGGTGLGLTISQRLIEMMGGQIGAEGRPGEGATFWFSVPLERADEVAAPVTSAPVGRGLGSARVLLVDDAPANRELVGGVLTSLGFSVETANDGAAAVAAVARGDYDLVLMDIHMPHMDGLAATRAIRAMGGRLADLPIVALTANVQAEHVAACRLAGMDDHLAKPIDFKSLVAALGRHLARPLDRCA